MTQKTRDSIFGTRTGTNHMVWFFVYRIEDSEQDLFLKQLVKSSELDQIMVKRISVDDKAILERALGSEWEETAVTQLIIKFKDAPLYFNVKYQRILEKPKN